MLLGEGASEPGPSGVSGDGRHPAPGPCSSLELHRPVLPKSQQRSRCHCPGNGLYPGQLPWSNFPCTFSPRFLFCLPLSGSWHLTPAWATMASATTEWPFCLPGVTGFGHSGRRPTLRGCHHMFAFLDDRLVLQRLQDLGDLTGVPRGGNQGLEVNKV